MLNASRRDPAREPTGLITAIFCVKTAAAGGPESVSLPLELSPESQSAHETRLAHDISEDVIHMKR